MTYDQMLLQVLQEECAELIKAASKINRFGPNDYYPGREDEGNNQAKFVAEAHDLLAVLHMVNERFGLHIAEGYIAESAIENKKKKTILYLMYSIEAGTLNGPIPEEPTRPSAD